MDFHGFVWFFHGGGSLQARVSGNKRAYQAKHWDVTAIYIRPWAPTQDGICWANTSAPWSRYEWEVLQSTVQLDHEAGALIAEDIMTNAKLREWANQLVAPATTQTDRPRGGTLAREPASSSDRRRRSSDSGAHTPSKRKRIAGM